MKEKLSRVLGFVASVMAAAAAFVCLPGLAMAAQTEIDIPDPDIGAVVNQFSDFYFGNWVLILTVGAVSLALAAAWMRLRRHAK